LTNIYRLGFCAIPFDYNRFLNEKIKELDFFNLDSLSINKKKINAKLGRDMRLASSSPTGFDNKIFPLKSFRLCRFLFPQ
jgi:hypothetical protein